jgi:hypothetical protein
MKRVLGYILLGLGAFLLLLAPLARFYVYPSLAKAPIDVYSKGTSVGTGTVFSIADLAEVQTEITSTRTTRGDVEASTDDLAVYDSFSNTANADGETLTASIERVGFDRFTGVADPEFDSTVDSGGGDGPESVTYEGQVFKMPFDTQQSDDYLWWDGSVQQATPISFEGAEDIDGLRTYKFVQTIEPTKIAELDVPGELVGSDEPAETIDRIYSNTRTIWIEPNTGAVVKGEEDQDSYGELDGERVLTITQAKVGYTPEAIAANVEEYSSLGSQLNLIKNVIPVWGAIIGVILLVLGGLLVWSSSGSRKRATAPASTTDATV